MQCIVLVGCARNSNIDVIDEPIVPEKEEKQEKEYDETACLYTSYEGLVMAGYQGWFTAKGDGAERGWHHYEANGKFETGRSTIDFWPDVNEYKKKYETAFVFENGDEAFLFSPYDVESVDLHFKWMKEYGIDGVYMQRFVSEIKGEKGKRHFNKVLENALKAAKKYDRAICIMYDLSGCSSADIDIVKKDWIELQSIFNLFDSSDNPTYLRHNKKPLLAIWGVGFNDNRKYNLEDIQHLVNNVKSGSNPVSIMLGVPYYWREKKNDAINSSLLHDIIKSADIVFPWAVGRYRNDSYLIASSMIQEDIHWCENNDVDYVPLVFPGFSWGNLQNNTAKYNEIPRLKGDFLWNQVATAKKAGAKMLYVAMFDEVDEGTAIFKCLRENEVPLNGDKKFVGIEKELESDYYLWLVGQATKWFHGEDTYGAVKPPRR